MLDDEYTTRLIPQAPPPRIADHLRTEAIDPAVLARLRSAPAEYGTPADPVPAGAVVPPPSNQSAGTWARIRRNLPRRFR